MQTTLTLDDDLAPRLAQVQQELGLTLDEVINTLVRSGLAQLSAPPPGRPPYRLTPVALKPRLPDVDNIADILAVVEGASYR